jgi:activator of HSP90 ATPase
MKDFKKYFTLAVEPEILYAALTTQHTIQLWTGDIAIMNPEPDTEFSLWDGSIEGRNISFEPNKQIVQEWYFGDENETPSIVTLKLHTIAKGTSVELHHTNIPDEAFDDICEGWIDAYFGNLANFYAAE